MVVMSVFACASPALMPWTVLAVAMSPMAVVVVVMMMMMKMVVHMTNPLRVPHHHRRSVLIKSLSDLSEDLNSVLLHHGVGHS